MPERCLHIKDTHEMPSKLLTQHVASRLGACRTWGSEKCTAAAHLQPTAPKSDRLLALGLWLCVCLNAANVSAQTQPIAKPNNLRDPFHLPPKPEVAPAPMRPTAQREREALELFPLETLHLRGILARNGQRRAVIETPLHHTLSIGLGDHIGQNEGLITAISDSAIVINERITSPDGHWQMHQVLLTLSSEVEKK